MRDREVGEGRGRDGGAVGLDKPTQRQRVRAASPATTCGFLGDAGDGGAVSDT